MRCETLFGSAWCRLGVFVVVRGRARSLGLTAEMHARSHIGDDHTIKGSRTSLFLHQDDHYSTSNDILS